MTTPSLIWICIGWTRVKPSRPICRRMIRPQPTSYATALFEFKRQFPELRNHTATPEQ